METQFKQYILSDDKTKLQPQRVQTLLNDTYWAKDRPLEAVTTSIAHSLCIGIYHDGLQIGFARCVTDYCSIYWLCDVIIDPTYRGEGLGKALMEFVVTHETLKSLQGILATNDAHGLYAQYGFKPSKNLMRKRPEW